ncbi:MAG TPA: hypothetical protein IAD28_05935 [Candidatus Faeciplasma avium]|uniref:Uncharacterized protein n=1 Tax=Candidatus Faeciplasma avium TaxID=2840798 RepID=A0A9D1NRL5_9FIRM|nr:hypothetical protein [Candidatus Faeciplasma avium]
MASFSPDSPEFGRMQEEALSRLREMQRRSRAMVGDNQAKSGSAPLPGGALSGAEKTHAGDNKREPLSAGPLGFLRDILGDSFELDADRLLLLLIIFMLYKNGADIKLLIALGYIFI